MAGSSVQTTLGDLVVFRSGGTPSKAEPEYWEGTIPWVSAKDMKAFRLFDVQDHISDDGLAAGSRIAPAGSVLLLTRGMTLLSDIPICVVDRPMAFNQDVKALEAGPRLDSAYLPYLLLGRKHELLASVDLAGHGTGRLNTDSLKKLKVDLPPLPEQRRIAHILGTLDEKIELNRRINETLEEMARALFKSWFVDFDPVRAKAEGRDPGLPAHLADLFPDRLVDSELGEIPAGWCAATIGSIAEVIDCLHSKKPERRDAGWPLLQLENIRGDGLLDMRDTYLIDRTDYDRWISRTEASPGDCVITNVGRVGAVAQAPPGFRGALGRNMTGLRCTSDFPFPTFLVECLLSSAMSEEIDHKTDAGTILDALNVRNVPRLRFARGPVAVVAVFERHARPLRARMEENLAESRALSLLKYALLPRLLSGEIGAPCGARIDLEAEG